MDSSNIKSIKKINSGKVRNLTVHKNHTFLTDNGICTHNCDGVSLQFFKALRGTIENFSKHVRFIATCNYINKVPPEIKSRFETITFDFLKDDEMEIKKGYMLRLHHICKAENLVIEKEALWTLVERTFPDMRTMINKIQGFKVEGLANVQWKILLNLIVFIKIYIN